MIAEYVIEQVKEASDIVEVVSSYISLTRKGQNYWARCPFHDEKTASFSVSPGKQIYHCFGCGAGGSVINFVMEYTKVGFIEAVKELAESAGIEIPEDREEKARKSEAQTLHDLHDWAMGLYEGELFGDGGREALEYLLARGLSEETLRRFHLGWAPAGWDFLVRSAKGEARALKIMEKGGLLSARDGGGYYDRFRERIMFPIRSAKGHCVGFGGRIIREAQDAKYLNSPETAIYHKAKVLYGLHEAIGEIRAQKKALVVEGYMDYLQLVQGGFANCVAGSGTAFTAEQGKLLKRYTNDAVLCYDSDGAGQKAALKAALLLSGQKVNVRVLRLPAGEDPDSYIKTKGAGAFQEALEGSLDVFDFMGEYSGVQAGSPAERAELLQQVSELIQGFPDPVYQEIFARDTAAVFKVQPETFIRSLQGGGRGRRGPEQVFMPSDPNRYTLVKDRSEATQFQILQLMLLEDEGIRRAAVNYLSPEIFMHNGYRKAADALLNVLSNDIKIRSDRIPEAIENEKIRNFFYKLLWDLQSQTVESRKAFLDCMREMEASWIRAEISEIEKKMGENDAKGEFDPDLAQESLNLTRRLKELGKIYTAELFE